MAREQYKCTMCGRPAEEVHHKVPRSKGGKNDSGNLVVLCRECHEMLHRKR
ncbi:MAG: HNH endonuclease [ANME-2 cluster archaeon]|nr:HNH endonuclease [ANME-2 cluster archaeon]MBC2702279.1 HNH endonuclease [ANME-2 cluster archaeon]MBC2708417.1 HNH endonuclease [ANME-2 cluster archaeon]MBC2745688.1 HNH endonuclease [ANME-2 cluster archaeon]MBC2764360.1 HNH endonuclease [ANME-2 cluster archaeon]